MEYRLLNALRRVLFFESFNSDKDMNLFAIKSNYIADNKVTLKGLKYIALKLKPECVIPGCMNKIHTTCFCMMHYQRYRRGLRGEALLYVDQKISKELKILLEQVCRNDVPFDISLMTKNRKFMTIVEEGLEKGMLCYKGENLIQITAESFRILD